MSFMRVGIAIPTLIFVSLCVSLCAFFVQDKTYERI